LMLATINPLSSAPVVVGTGVGVRVDVGAAVGIGVAEGVDVVVDVGRGVDVAVDVGRGVDVGVDVGTAVGGLVAVPGAPLRPPDVPPAMAEVSLPVVGVGVAVDVAVGVEVEPVVGVGVAVRVAVDDGVATASRDGPNDATEKLLITRSAGAVVAVGDGVAVNVGVAVAVGVGVSVATAAVSAAKTVKCEDSPVTVPAPWLTLEPPSTGRQLPLAVSKKNTPAGGDPLNARVI
jgi:hypothetical protein